VSNALYDKGREGFLDGSIDFDTDTIKIALVLSTYTVNLATHQFVTDLGANILIRSSALTSKTVAAGVADAADVLFALLAGAAFRYIVIYKDTGSDATSRLIAYLDTATGLPTTPNGADLTVVWDNTAGLLIFKL
jgi:hypothetical protein